MAKTQKASLTLSNPTVFFVVVLIILLTCFLLLSPKVASMLFPFKRQAVWNNFLQTVQKEKKVDPQAYWEFREFYSPGYFTLATQGLTEPIIQETLTTIALPVDRATLAYPFAQFTSQRLVSIDALTGSGVLPQVMNRQPENVEVLFRNEQSLIYIEDGMAKIIFILPENEMKKAVGFFEYEGKDKELTAGKYWLNITSLRLD